MPYAEGRTFFDADSHVMELPSFVHDYADPGIRPRLRPMPVTDDIIGADARELAGTQAHPEEWVAELERNVMGPKGYRALGAFNPDERTRALDLLGFTAQLVFATFSPQVFLWLSDLDARYGGCRAHNRAMAEFCAGDPRMLPVGLVSLADPERAVVELEHALDLGIAAMWIPAEPCGGRSPGHDALDPFWARLAEAGVPFVLHVGGSPLQVRPEYMNTGRPVPTDWLGGGENVRGKDFPVLHQPAEEFLSVLVLDGVLERHPELRGAAVELGATWVPGMLARLDHAWEIWARSEPELKAMGRRPSEQVRAQLGFTPYPFEDVGRLIAASSDELYLFSSDYPHPEGGRNPIARFSHSLDGADDTTLERFYAANFARVLPVATALA